MATSSSTIKRRRARSSKAESRTELRLGHPGVLITVTVLSLVLLGVMMILSASSVYSFASYGSSFWFFKKQLLWALLGVTIFFLLSRLDYRKLRHIGYPALLVVALLLGAVLVPGFGISAGGSARWVPLGPLAFQPSEAAKLALVLFAAGVFARKGEAMVASFSHALIPLVPALGLLAGLVMLQPDLGTTLLLAVIAIGMLFVAGARFRHLIPLSLMGAALAVVAGILEPYRRDRILAFMNPWKDPLGNGYQAIQSLIALGSGSWFGVGLGASRQKWSYIPNAHTDFIFAILGEEMGLLGTLMVLALFAFIAYLGLRTARAAPDRFGMLLASGITIWISVQALVNIGAATASLPITGVPLPLVSFGGTSLVISLAAMGLLVSVARGGEEVWARRSNARRRASRAGARGV
jgi:cell division protein FtsW